MTQSETQQKLLVAVLQTGVYVMFSSPLLGVNSCYCITNIFQVCLYMCKHTTALHTKTQRASS